MPSSKTSNYQLSQWAKSDRVLMADFNSDNAKIDAAIKAVDSRVTSVSNSKASTSALNSLKTTVNTKASQADLDSLAATVDTKASQLALTTLSSTVNQHTTTLTKKGNCTIYTTSYTGNGSIDTKTLTFPSKPQVVIIAGGKGSLVMVQGASTSTAMLDTLSQNVLTWSGNSVSWYHHGSGDAPGMMNAQGTTYRVVALFMLQ